MPNTAPDSKAPASGAQRVVHVAVAVIVRDGRVLIARRPEHVHQGGLLEFPGGKVEPGETVQQALVREIVEETGLRVPESGLEPVIGIRHDYGDKQVFLDVWQTATATGEPFGREGQPIEWLAPEDLADADFPAANRPIIRALRLPNRLAITGDMEPVAEAVGHLQQRLAQGAPELLMLRAPGLSTEGYQVLAQQVLPLASERGSRLILHGRPELLEVLPGAAGVHLSWAVAREFDERPVPEHFLLGVSCHDAGQLEQAQKLSADYVVLGPVLPTPSHPDEPGMGWQVFQQLVAGATVPVFALGGMTADQELQARQMGGQGIAGIGFWWR